MASKEFFGFLDEMWITWGYRLVLHLECFGCVEQKGINAVSYKINTRVEKTNFNIHMNNTYNI